jgi:hypothetical protein
MDLKELLKLKMCSKTCPTIKISNFGSNTQVEEFKSNTKSSVADKPIDLISQSKTSFIAIISGSGLSFEPIYPTIKTLFTPEYLTVRNVKKFSTQKLLENPLSLGFK